MSLNHQTPKGTFVSNKLARFDRDFGTPMAQADAAALAKTAHSAHGQAEPLRIALKILPNPERTDARLVYWVDFEDRLMILDAQSGQIVHDISKHRAIAALPKLRVYNAQGMAEHTAEWGDGDDLDQLPQKLKNVCQLISTKDDSSGSPILIHPDRCTLAAENSVPLPGADDDSVRALQNSGAVAQYYAETQNRSSFDDQGTELVSVVHVGDSFDNAYWDEEGSFMAYGDGDGKVSRSYTLALDIVGHEMTHGVTAATAKLLGTGEAGALNEAYSDFFGIMISNSKEARSDWTIGKEIFPGGPGQEAGMRSLARPGKFMTSVFTDAKQETTAEVPFPSKMSEKLAQGQECTDKNDQCEVHGNSTIPSHASYLVAKALEDSNAPAQSRFDRAAKLYYTVLTQWLTSTDCFATAANDTVQACKLMYNADDCAKVAHAFAMTEMLPTPP
jgi:Zn-dependent metalloprotease